MKINKTRILIIEDNENFKRALKSLIRSGHSSVNIDEAANEKESFEKIDGSGPDLVFSDISLQGENGFALIAKIRSACPLARIVAMSHETSDEYEKAAIKHGADRYIPKSILTPGIIDELVAPLILKAGKRKKKDRRKSPRYKSKTPVFVRMNSENEAHLGQLLDIGKGGLSLCYPGSEDPACAYMDLDIFTMQGDFCIRNLQGRMVCGFNIPPPVNAEATDSRRIGLQFVDPKALQKAELDFFLGNHTAGAA